MVITKTKKQRVSKVSKAVEGAVKTFQKAKDQLTKSNEELMGIIADEVAEIEEKEENIKVAEDIIKNNNYVLENLNKLLPIKGE